ncbi:hypothetical protein LZG04_19235 [Saccharothrix sp. S26]|uniref:hypothetical protein n=1 Tax=Saccharothrix sp. S26 TaxID=2907215 RepID=UPI001F1B4EB7|nr:hypothetical protein [Saccharothrix sp. S26]MCE6996919.1 hypothetical protein [Saccharothrix sp. S26]
MRLRFSQSARKHRIGRAHALHVINNYPPTALPVDDNEDPKLFWTGEDDRGVGLEIVGVELEADDVLLIIHVMPTHYRDR